MGIKVEEAEVNRSLETQRQLEFGQVVAEAFVGKPCGSFSLAFVPGGGARYERVAFRGLCRWVRISIRWLIC